MSSDFGSFCELDRDDNDRIRRRLVVGRNGRRLDHDLRFLDCCCCYWYLYLTDEKRL